MELYKVSVDNKEFKSVPQKEVLFFVQAGAILNELNILHKLLYISNRSVKGTVETKAQNSQTLFILSILTGKLWESWRFLEKSFFATKISKDYDQLLPEEAKNQLIDLKFYFGKENLIKEVRKKLAFHYDAKEIERAVDEILKGDIPEFYLSEDQGNSYFYIADLIRLKTILDYTGISEAFEALDKFFTEVLNVAKLFILFLNHCLVVVARNHKNWKLEKIHIKDPPKINDILLPYFVGKPEATLGSQ